MVNFSQKLSCIILLAGQCLLAGCSNDLFGLFGSTPVDERFKERTNFTFLRPEDRTLSLGDEYSFLVITDTHIENKYIYGLEKIREVIAADSSIKFVVIVGDITQNGRREDFEQFIEFARTLNVPCYPVIGNHDIYFNTWGNWKDLIGSTVYRIDGGNTTLLMLDSANATFGKNQLDWLENQLQSAGGRVFIFSHVNLFVKSLFSIQQFTDTRERNRICAMLRGRADAMFMGHVHRRIREDVGGVTYLSIEDFRSNGVYCRVSVSAGGINYHFFK